MDHMRISGTEPSSVILSQIMKFEKLQSDDPIVPCDDPKGPKQAEAKRDGVRNPQNYNFKQFLKSLWRWEPDRMSIFFFSPPSHLCAVTYITEISLHQPLNNQSCYTLCCVYTSGLYEYYIPACMYVNRQYRATSSGTKIRTIVTKVKEATQ